jgi:ATP-dependent Clp endopeptidase proteolytic subunit ClpP
MSLKPERSSKTSAVKKSLKTEKHNDSNLWSWFDQNLDIEKRTIYMGSMSSHENGESGVDNFMAEYFIKGMYFLESRNKKPINIVMNNPGGDWYHGMAIYDSIKYSVCKTSMKVYGHAMSMGSIILQAANERIMMPNSRFMIHYGTDGIYGHSKISEKWAEESKRNNYDMENIYIQRMMEKEEQIGTGHIGKTLTSIITKHKEFEYPRISDLPVYIFSKNIAKKTEEIRQVLKELLNFDTILTPEETVNLGFADSIYE